ncbi:hypothetical protein NC651_034260 [Populus alba x Populus x berolinensis]|nr:hypothetical protein NC651_034260 [Populus alba x Populus x berolinensis]
MAASQAALLLHRFFLEKVSGPRWEALDRREKPASSDASHINPFIQLDKAKDSELYKPVLMESYTSPVLITHQSKGKCELQIQTFREFSARTSYSQK